jgi:hypothetical protein
MWQSRPSAVAQDVYAPASTSSGVWYGGTNSTTLTRTPASIVLPAPSITTAGNYMFIGNLSVQETTGGYPEVECYVQAGKTALLTSTTGVEASQQGNVTSTGAVKLTSKQVPATVSLMCSNANNGTAVATSASISVFSVGTLQTGK